jgi:hypothetical protein
VVRGLSVGVLVPVGAAGTTSSDGGVIAPALIMAAILVTGPVVGHLPLSPADTRGLRNHGGIKERADALTGDTLRSEGLLTLKKSAIILEQIGVGARVLGLKRKPREPHNLDPDGDGAGKADPKHIDLAAEIAAADAFDARNGVEIRPSLRAGHERTGTAVKTHHLLSTALLI